jgi:hypothetical protein
MAVGAVLFVAFGTFLGIELWGRSPLYAFAIAVLVLVLLGVWFRISR